MKLFSKSLINSKKNQNKILLIILLTILVALITYVTGGTQYAWSQMNIIVIVLAAYFWQNKGSFFVATLLGLIIGPLMPLNVSEGIMQTPKNWILRIAIYLLSAGISEYIFKEIDKNNKQTKEKILPNSFEIYDTSELFTELNKMIENDEKFCLLFFRIVNLEGISKYVNYRIVEKIIHETINHFKINLKNCNLYSVNFNEYVFILKNYNGKRIIQKVSSYIKDYLKSMKIDNYSFKLIIKSGIVFNNGEKVDAVKVFNEARIAADQGGNYESGVYTYNTEFNKNKELFYEISGSLNNAIKNNEFFLVYQPIISLQDNMISEVETLLRWNRGNREPVGPQLFISIAEKIGFINQITKWVIERTIIQKKEWEKNNLKITTLINATSTDIEDKSLHAWAVKVIKKSGIEKSDIGIEITERIPFTGKTKFKNILLELKAEGYKILIDDFGTGYNSLMAISEIPFNVVKIDKYFIDRLDELEVKLLIKYTIKFVHEMNGQITAEGVETKEQLKILKELGCDMIQGYYFSKPLLPNEFENYYKNFDMQDYL